MPLNSKNGSILKDYLLEAIISHLMDFDALLVWLFLFKKGVSVFTKDVMK